MPGNGRIPTFIDTSSLRGETQASSAALQRLKELVDRQLVTVYVSEIAMRELATGLVQKANEGGAKIEKEQRRTFSWLAEEDDRAAVLAAIDKLASAMKAAQETIARGVRARLAALQAEIVPLNDEIVKAAWDGYFAGTSPYKALKNRNDIPDAHICATARAIQRRLGEPLHVIVGDGTFGAAFDGDANFVTHESIGKFNVSAKVTEAVRQHEEEQLKTEERDDWQARVQQAVTNEIEFIRTEIGSSLIGTLDGYLVKDAPQLPSGNGEATVDYAGDLDDLRFAFNSIEDLGRTSALVNITATFVDAQLSVFIYKSDYWAMDEEEHAKYELVDGDWNEHYVLVEMTAGLTVEAVARIELEIDENEVMNVATVVVDDVEDVEVFDN